MYRFDSFQLADMVSCGTDIRRIGTDALTVEETGDRTVRYLYDKFRMDGGERALVLVRLFKTRTFDELDASLKKTALNLVPDAHRSNARFLCLISSVGACSQWNNPEQSKGHRIIPIGSEEMQIRSPMIAHLFSQFGLNVRPSEPCNVDSIVLEPEQRTFNVFYVPDASGCSFIPAQEEFVRPFGIKSVLGFGSMLNRGSLFAFVLFSRVFISRETAHMFNPLALSAKNALINCSELGAVKLRSQLA